MNMGILKNLEKFGLSETEAKIYYAVLALEKTTADKIATRAHINRTSCYAILERLKNLGLVSQIKKSGKTIFKASGPDKFLDILEEKKEAIQNVLPELKSLFEIIESKPDVRFYEGKEGLKAILNSILKETQEVLIFGDGESFKKAIPGWTDYYLSKRISHKIKAKIILRGTPSIIEIIKKLKLSSDERSNLTKFRILPEAYVSEYSGFDVFNDKVVFYSFEKQNLAVIIKSKIISQMMKNIFEALWDDAEKYNNTLLKD